MSIKSDFVDILGLGLDIGYGLNGEVFISFSGSAGPTTPVEIHLGYSHTVFIYEGNVFDDIRNIGNPYHKMTPEQIKNIAMREYYLNKQRSTFSF